MYSTAAVKSYRQTNYLSADPLKLVRMCYEGAISNLKLARDAYLDKRYEDKGKALIKSLDIIHELNAALDMERGGEIAKNLRSLYLYMSQSLIDADIKRNVAGFDAVINMLEDLESAWHELAAANIDHDGPAPSIMAGETKKAGMVSNAWSA